jgi:hypothetical protein
MATDSTLSGSHASRGTALKESELTSRCQQIVSQHENGQEITGPDREFVMALLRHHPDADQAWLARAARSTLTVGSNRYGTRSFYLVDTDGTREDFSWKKCVGNYS